MAPKTTSAARSSAARSVPEPAATSAAIAAMPSWASPRHAPSSVWHSGTISAAGFGFPVNASFRPCRVSSVAAGSPPDTGGCPGFCRYYYTRGSVFLWVGITVPPNSGWPILAHRPSVQIPTRRFCDEGHDIAANQYCQAHRTGLTLGVPPRCSIARVGSSPSGTVKQAHLGRGVAVTDALSSRRGRSAAAE